MDAGIHRLSASDGFAFFFFFWGGGSFFQQIRKAAASEGFTIQGLGRVEMVYGQVQ